MLDADNQDCKLYLTCSTVQQRQSEPGVDCGQLLGGAAPRTQAAGVRQAYAHELQCHPRPLPYARHSQ